MRKKQQLMVLYIKGNLFYQVGIILLFAKLVWRAALIFPGKRTSSTCNDNQNDKPKFTIIFIIFWDFLMSYQIFLSPQIKQCAVITYKHGIYELPHKLLNDSRLTILETWKIPGKSVNSSAHSSSQSKHLVNTSKKLLKNKN